MAQLRSLRCAFHWSGECRQPEGRWAWQPRRPSNSSGSKRDVKRLKSSTPIVVFAHIPLWSIYPEWGWGTDDSAQALSYLKRFGSVSVLNGHIHQVMQKVEGHITFHTAMSTAFPQPAPGTAPSPGPMKVEADRLKEGAGYRARLVPRRAASHRGHRRRARRNRPGVGHWMN